MPQKLTTTVNKISTVPHPANVSIIQEFYQYMRSTGASEHHQNNNLKVVIAFAKSPMKAVSHKIITRYKD
ncbi:MAG TPA: hypothetical protein VE076_13215 [Nitrososphaeraceae archaeon]|jgi:hypothetical protein|nr:hypothetical protein [Nitrososphaeraceae archaeon]